MQMPEEAIGCPCLPSLLRQGSLPKPEACAFSTKLEARTLVTFLSVPSLELESQVLGGSQLVTLVLESELQSSWFQSHALNH